MKLALASRWAFLHVVRRSRRVPKRLGPSDHLSDYAIGIGYFLQGRIFDFETFFPPIPAMAAGVSDRLWEIGDIVKLVEDAEMKPGKRGTYKNRNRK